MGSKGEASGWRGLSAGISSDAGVRDGSWGGRGQGKRGRAAMATRREEPTKHELQ
jgi:hypothetical protein